MFATPSSIEKCLTISDGAQLCTLTYKGCVLEPHELRPTDLNKLFHNSYCDDGHLRYQGQVWVVNAEGEDLVFHGRDVDADDRDVIKEYISDRLTAYVVEHSEGIKLAQELVDVTGGAAMFTDTVTSTIASLKGQAREVPPEFWQEVIDAAESDRAEWLELIASLYLTHYTKDELLGLINFHKSDLGRKVLATTPAITNDCLVLGQRYAASIAAQVAQKLEDDKNNFDTIGTAIDKTVN